VLTGALNTGTVAAAKIRKHIAFMVRAIDVDEKERKNIKIVF